MTIIWICGDSLLRLELFYQAGPRHALSLNLAMKLSFSARKIYPAPEDDRELSLIFGV